ncbi:hypothetical protein ACIQYZ_28580 [Rhodococcus erythropolis]
MAVLENAKQLASSLRASLVYTPPPLPEYIPRQIGEVVGGPLLRAAEADATVAGTRLDDIVAPAVDAAGKLQTGDLSDSLSELLRVVEIALASIAVEANEPPASEIDEVVDELERAFLLSLCTTLTAHSYIVREISEWETRAQQAAKAGKSAPAKFFSVKDLKFVSLPGLGRIHVQHLIAAIDSGQVAMAVGSPLVESTRYPEMQIAVYGQWFTYMHAIWDEQIRKRLAAAHGCRASDISIPLFGDIRLIRNDFVHKKGIAGKSATNTEVLVDWFTSGASMEVSAEQMLKLIELFPRKELLAAPVPKPLTRKPIGGSIPFELETELETRMDKSGISDRNTVWEQALRLWIDSESDK